MKAYTYIAAVLVAWLCWAAPAAYAQVSPPDQPTAPTGVAIGTIKSMDLRPGGSITLDDGTMLTMPPDSEQLQWTSLPQFGDQVQVTFDNEDGRNVVRSIEVESSSGAGDGGN
jgi:hypothetical protein